MSKGSNRRPTLNKELADKNWAQFEANRKAKKEADKSAKTERKAT